MIAGFAVCIWYTFGTEYYGVPLLFKGTALTEKGLSNLSAGVIGIPVSFVVTIVVSLMTRAPSREMQGFIEAIRTPRGGTMMKEARQAELTPTVRHGRPAGPSGPAFVWPGGDADGVRCHASRGCWPWTICSRH